MKLNACEGISTEAIAQGVVKELLEACKIITESRDVFVWNLDANGRIVLRLTPDEINVISKAISRATGNGEGE